MAELLLDVHGVAALLCEVAELPSIDLHAKLRDQGVDSLDLLELLVEVVERHGIEFDESAFGLLEVGFADDSLQFLYDSVLRPALTVDSSDQSA